MAYSVEPLPKQPGQGNPVPDQPPLVKLKIYIVGGGLCLRHCPRMVTFLMGFLRTTSRIPKHGSRAPALTVHAQ